MRWSLFSLLTLLVIFPITTHTQSIEGACDTASDVQQNTWIPRFLPVEGELRLVDYISGDVIHVLERELTTNTVNSMAWSPDCRYLAGHIGGFRDATLVVWDTISGIRVNEIDNLHLYKVRFSPDNSQLLVEARSGAFLWIFDSNERIQLTDYFRCYGLSFGQVEWDYINNYFIGVEKDYSCRFVDGPLRIYDLDNGGVVQELTGSDFSIHRKPE
ncbi:MAG: hypothetical protein AAF125_04395, partial [Chloroflexota bacterium]